MDHLVAVFGVGIVVKKAVKGAEGTAMGGKGSSTLECGGNRGGERKRTYLLQSPYERITSLETITSTPTKSAEVET